MTRKERQQRLLITEPPLATPEQAPGSLDPSSYAGQILDEAWAVVTQDPKAPIEPAPKATDPKRERSPEIELLLKALRIAGSSRKLAEWIQTPVPALNGHTPYALMQSEEGRKQVDSVLGRIEHGVY
jgi:hypothetical protein